MPKAAVAQTGFHTGEISPLCYGVFDNPRYKKGLQVGLNFLPVLQGPLIRRPGTKYVTNVKDSANPPILVPFQFSATQTYMLEFGNQYIRFFANNGEIVTTAASYKFSGAEAVAGSIGGILPLNFYATRRTTNPQPYENISVGSIVSVSSGSILELPSPYAVADLPLLRWAQNADTIYLAHPNYPLYKLQRQTQEEWKLQAVYLIDGPYLAANSYLVTGDNVGVKMACIANSLPTSQAMTVSVATISNAANDGTGRIQITTASAHGLVSGQSIFITGVNGTTEANNWSTFAGRTNSTGPGYWVVSVVSSTVFILLNSTFTNAYSSGGTVYPSVFGFSAADEKASFLPRDLGRLLALQISGKRYWATITVVFDAATVAMVMGGTDISTPVQIPSTGTADAWYLGTYSGNSTSGTFLGGGYPACVTFHQNRMALAGAVEFPQEIDFSSSKSFEDFAISDPTSLQVTDDRSISINLASSDLNPIRWMESTAQGLLAGTYSSEWAITPSTNAEALTPTNINAQQTSFFGAADVAPTKIGNSVMYVQRAYRKLRELAFFFAAGTFRSADLSEISEHMTLPSIKQIAVQKETQPLVWSRRSDGALLSMVYNRDDVSLSAGWMRHFLGGNGDSSGNPAKVLAIGFIPDPTISFDQMWLVVQRYINGATVCTIEYMTKIPDSSISQADSFCVDAGGTYNGVPTTTVTGLTWLVGETVGVLTDGGIHPDCVVSNAGVITLNYPASKVQVGYRYKSQGQLLRAEAGAADGTSIGKTRRTTRAAFQLYRTGDISIGTDFSNLIPLQLAQADQNQADTATPLFSGIIREGLESAYDFDSQICFEMSSPLPGTVQSITSFMEEFDP